MCYSISRRKGNVLKYLYYRPQRSCGKVMFSQASVILFTGGCGRGACVAGVGNAWQGVGNAWQGVCGGEEGGTRTWQERRPLQRTVRILLECILVLILIVFVIM